MTQFGRRMTPKKTQKFLLNQYGEFSALNLPGSCSIVCCAKSSPRSQWYQAGLHSFLATLYRYLLKQPCPVRSCTSRKVRVPCWLTPYPVLQHRPERCHEDKTSARSLQSDLPPILHVSAGLHTSRERRLSVIQPPLGHAPK